MFKGTESYIPALKYHWLTSLYDPVIALTTRERTFKNQLITQADLADDHTILDVGCGTGTLACRIKQRYPSSRIYGLDGDKNILEIAKRKAEKANINIQFDPGLSYELPYPDNTFDRVVTSLFFHHLTLSQKERTLMEILRVLKTGGELHIADWGRPDNVLMRILFYQVQLLDGFTTTHENVKGLLPGIIRNSGFDAVRINTVIQTIFGTLSLISAKKPDGSGAII